MSLASLQPAPVWAFFRLLSAIPRPSGHEHALRETLCRWASERGLWHEQDEAGNLLIRKPATPGYEDRPTVILQGHLDMVAQKMPDSPHDFHRDPIEMIVDDGWLRARGTTLGADNGLGVAAALAVLDSQELRHGPLEALFTIEEESSMRGALELRPNWLQGSLLLNLDSEDRGDVYVGCAGGVDVNVRRCWPEHPLPADWIPLRLAVSGLRGGHSGLDIHKGRGHANRLLVRLLATLLERQELRLARVVGGTLRNALPREAEALVYVAADTRADVERQVEAFALTVARELAGVESGVRLVVDASVEIAPSPLRALDAAATREWVGAVLAAPIGVERLSPEFPGVVETSSNLGVVRLEQGVFEACLLVRSLRDSDLWALAQRIRWLFQLVGAEVSSANAYPGWTPSASSPLLQHFQRVHEGLFAQSAAVKVIHAGLECGIIGARYPRLDMVSFGPVIRGAHSPEERVEIASVGAFWDLLVALLAQLPAASGACQD